MKDFLVGKLRDAELALKRSIDEQKKTQRQAQSDSEVINFLDARVQVRAPPRAHEPRAPCSCGHAMRV